MLLTKRDYYKPFNYPWAVTKFNAQRKMNWMEDEVLLNEDIKDWRDKLSPAEKNFLTQIFRFFTQGDIDVAGAYNDIYLPHFKQPEVRMMLNWFAAMEATHVSAYAHLLETVGIPETEYKAFLSYEEMKAKHDYLTDFGAGVLTPTGLARAIAAYSAFGEGLQLFSSFAMLLNFQNYGKMKGMCQIVAWSIRDEELHVDGMTTLYRELVKENQLNSPAFNLGIYNIGHSMVALEDKFIDLAFQMGGIEGLTPELVKQYVRYVADKRFVQLGLKEEYFQPNPFPWIDYLLNGQEHTNFFENRSTSYTRSGVTGNFQDVYKEVFGL